MEIKTSKPYTDSDLVWNKITGHYELSLEYCKSHFSENFKDDGIMQKRITKNSRTVYNYLMSKTHSQNKSVVNFFLNKTEMGRKFLLDILSAQMESDLEFGTNDLGITPLVNTTNGQIIDRTRVMQNILCISAEQVLDNSTSYFDGINLFVAVLLPYSYFKFVRDNEEDF